MKKQNNAFTGHRLRRLPGVFASDWLYLLLMALAGAAIAFIICFGCFPSHYESSATLYVPKDYRNGTAALCEDTDILTVALLKTGQYEDLTADELSEHTSTKDDGDTVLTVTVWDEDPYTARDLVNALSDTVVAKADSTLSADIRTLSAGAIPEKRAFPILWLTLLLGILGGLLLAGICCIVIVLKDDTIYDETDAALYLGLPVFVTLTEQERKEDGDAARNED